MKDETPAASLVAGSTTAPAPRAGEDEPPVVARLVIEIRSDGSRTIARGALEDATTGQRTAVEARGTTPLSLMVSLSRSLVRLPALARRAARAMLPRDPSSR
jgi:hypothetical protein